MMSNQSTTLTRIREMLPWNQMANSIYWLLKWLEFLKEITSEESLLNNALGVTVARVWSNVYEDRK